jgi:hypothetical protein
MILRGIQKNASFDVFGAQSTNFFISNLNIKRPSQQTHTLDFLILPKK